MGRRHVSTGTPWEERVGYSRAVRVGAFVAVAGTTASNENGETIAPGDPFGQTRYVLEKIEAALAEVGASLAHVIRTRMFVTDIGQMEEVGRAHAEFFGDVRPAATMVEIARLTNPDHVVEIEVDAIVTDET